MLATIATGIRLVNDRQMTHARNLTVSLPTMASKQRLVNEAGQSIDVETILVDYGSRQGYDTILESMCNDLGVKYIRTEADEWSRSHCLNIAIKHSSGRYFLPVDADTLLSSEYARVLTTQANRFAPCIPFSFVARLKRFAPSWQEAFDQKDLHIPPSGRSHCCIPRSLLLDINGYDERFRIWGKEDDELYVRLQRAGYPPREVKDKAILPAHLPHVHNLIEGSAKTALKENEAIYHNVCNNTKHTTAPQHEWGVIRRRDEVR